MKKQASLDLPAPFSKVPAFIGWGRIYALDPILFSYAVSVFFFKGGYLGF